MRIKAFSGVSVYTFHAGISARQRARESVARRKMLQSSTVLNLHALRWVYTFDAVKRRIRRHALRWFAALAGAFRLASACASVLAKSINPRAYINVGKN